MTKLVAEFRFYEELNDFLPLEQRKKTIAYAFIGHPSVKDAIESFGVPHTEVDLILVNGESVDFAYQLKDQDRIAVYPVFETLDISNIVKLREKPLRTADFVLDVHLGRLAKYMRMLGFSVLYQNNLSDPEIIALAGEHRIILTRDKGLLKNKIVTHGYWIRSTKPKEQLQEVIQRFDLKNLMNPFTRCIDCNGLLTPIEKEKILHRLLPKTKAFYHHFYICEVCNKLYWPGSHYKNMKNLILQLAK